MKKLFVLMLSLCFLVGTTVFSACQFGDNDTSESSGNSSVEQNTSDSSVEDSSTSNEDTVIEGEVVPY